MPGYAPPSNVHGPIPDGNKETITGVTGTHLSTEVCAPPLREIPVDVNSHTVTLTCCTHSVLTPQPVICPSVLCHEARVRRGEKGIVGMVRRDHGMRVRVRRDGGGEEGEEG